MDASPQYDNLRNKIVAIMAAAALIPVLLLAAINYAEFQTAFTREAQTPLRSMVAKSRSAFELFLAERSSTVSLIASAYSYEDLANHRQLQHIFRVMQKEFSGFVDLGLINAEGRLVNYAGPHKELQGIDYSRQEWFNKVRFQNRFVSEVFEGFRQIPHMVIAVRHTTENGKSWIVRATLDTSQFARLIAAMNLEPGSDAFLLSRTGYFQTDSTYYGKTLERFPLPMPAPSFEANVVNAHSMNGDPIMMAYSYFTDTNFVLVAIKPTKVFFQNWFLLRTDLLLIFCASALCIYLVAAKSVGQLIERLRESDMKRDEAFLQMEHSQKLSSIGRLAAGVAHEINNPLAIINEKAGLLGDLVRLDPAFPKREQFTSQIKAIHNAVTRCRDITHRMLGFARRMDVKIEELDVNVMIRETLSFLEREALHRNVTIVQELADNLPAIHSDRGQLQQVFLNVLNNAFAAVGEKGTTIIRSALHGEDAIAVSFYDNGCGMSEEVRKHIFEPFFTTKKGEGTGLGMSIIYGIVKRHGGDIQVESEPGKGTTVTIILPVRQPSREV